MNKPNLNASVLSLALDRTAAAPMHAQLTRQLRQLILSRRIEPGGRFPSSRSLAEDLGVSRITVRTAIDQLISEGYAEGRRGSGVFVVENLPDYAPMRTPPRRTADLPPLPQPEPVRPFEVAAPDMRAFPFRDWARTLERVWRKPETALLSVSDPCGWAPLRQAIARHLYDWRGIACEPAQIFVTSGVVEAVDLIAKAALDPGDTVLMEEPGYDILRRALTANGLRHIALPVDDLGFNVPKVRKTAPEAKAAAVTPSRHYPLGMTLPLARRLELLEWAAGHGGYVIEDDFDSEYRYQGQPLPALMSLDREERVIYIGSFSKVLFPSLRLGFLVMPPQLIDTAQNALTAIGAKASLIAQPVLAQFMDDGGFATHIRRMRRLYAERQRALLAAADAQPGFPLELSPQPAGMHLVAGLRSKRLRRMGDVESSRCAAAAGITARPLSQYYAGTPKTQGLVLGYSGFNEVEIEDAVAALAKALGRVNS